MEDQNVAEIKRQVKTLKVPVDYKEEKFGGTLLMLAVLTNKYRSVKALLALGANPNTPDDTVRNFGRNAVIFASMHNWASADILRLLLENGGNPNSVECGVQEDGFGNFNPACNSALFYAVFASFEKVKILVEAGADVNLETSARMLERCMLHLRIKEWTYYYIYWSTERIIIVNLKGLILTTPTIPPSR